MRPIFRGFRGVLLGLILIFATAQVAAVWSPAHAAPQTQSQSDKAKADSGGKSDTAKSGDDQKSGGSQKGKAAGNGASASGKSEGLLIAEVLLLLVVGRLLGEVMTRFGQPSLMGTLLAGIILGPSLFG